MDIKLRDIYIDESPERYIPSSELVKALEVAYALKRPLLISGEPGTGKTNFARWVAKKLENSGFHGAPFIYNVKSTSTAQDLFYHYDAVSHFRTNQTLEKQFINNKTQEINQNDVKTTIDFIELKAMGLAFAYAIGLNGAGTYDSFFKKCGVGSNGFGTVVLIDEIDKAPRDFPNDLLNEIERYDFELREINRRITLTQEQRKRIIIILTSNLEKILPEAFLRRCIYFHIGFPSSEMLLRIVKERLNLDEQLYESVMVKINEFFIIRNTENIYKKPSTSEFIDWIRVLREDGLLHKPLISHNNDLIKDSPILAYLHVILKKQEDLQLFTNP